MNMPQNTSEFLFRRNDLDLIQRIVLKNSRVLDLGCGSGRLLKKLKTMKNASVTGVERDLEKIRTCLANGVPCIQFDINKELSFFPDNSFDYVILSRTIQSVDRPDLILSEMLRIGQKGIISFLNFGHINERLQLLLGRMPVTKALPRPWYDNHTIHPATIKDFRDLCKKKNFRIELEEPLSARGDFLPFFSKMCPNLFASTCIFVISK